MALSNVDLLIEKHEFKVGDPVLICGHRELPGVIIDDSELQLKVKLNGSLKNIYTTRCKTYTKPDVSKIYQDELKTISKYEEVIPLPAEEEMIVISQEGSPKQILLF